MTKIANEKIDEDDDDVGGKNRTVIFDSERIRVVQWDERNLAITEFRSGGIVSRGRYAGQEMKPGWFRVGFYSDLRAAMKKLVEQAIVLGMPEMKDNAEGIIAKIDEIYSKIDAKIPINS